MEPNKNKRYGTIEYWSFEMVCTPNTKDWYDDPTRMIIYPSGKNVADMIQNSKIRHGKMIIKRTKKYEDKCLKYKEK